MGIYFKITAGSEGGTMRDYTTFYYIEDRLYMKQYHPEGWDEVRDEYLAQDVELTEEMGDENADLN